MLNMLAEVPAPVWAGLAVAVLETAKYVYRSYREGKNHDLTIDAKRQTILAQLESKDGAEFRGDLIKLVWALQDRLDKVEKELDEERERRLTLCQDNIGLESENAQLVTLNRRLIRRARELEGKVKALEERTARLEEDLTKRQGEKYHDL